MKTTRSIVCLVSLFTLFASCPARAGYSNLFVFGDSLSDSGNNAVIFAPNVTPVPISDNSFVPTYPYASGRYTDAQVWAQYLAGFLGLTANPSLLGGTDYAFGGARTGPLSADLFNPFPPTLQTQVAYFLQQQGNVAPNDALYVIAGGGQNARDAVEQIATTCLDQTCVAAVIASAAAAYATDAATMVGELGVAGADSIVVWDTPDVGKAPALIAAGGSALGTLVASAMNQALVLALGSDPNVKIFDVFGLVDDVVANPGAFGLANVSDACARFIACDPSTFLFWDGIHPTSAGHMIIAQAMLRTVPEPATLALLGLGLAALALSRRKLLQARETQRRSAAFEPRSSSRRSETREGYR